MRIKKSFFIKQKVIFVLLLFSFFAFSGIIYTFRSSSVLDRKHIQMVEFSDKVEIEIFNGRIEMDELLDGNETILDSSVFESFAKANKYIQSVELISAKSKRFKSSNEEYFLQQLSEIVSSIHRLEGVVRSRLDKDLKGFDASLTDAYFNFTLKFDTYEKALHLYISESNYRLKKEIFILLGAIFVILIICLILIVRLMNSLIRANRELLRNTIEVEQKERRRIAMDLHDGLGAMLSSVGMYSKILEKEFKNDEQTHAKLNKITLLSNQALQTVSEVINNLNPSILNRHNIVESLDRLCSKINSIGNLKLDLEVSGFCGQMDKSREVIFYRICSELINNTIKHANATKATITLSRTTKVILKYQDNGSGFDVSQLSLNEKRGMGLSNIIDRIESIGGQCFIETSVGKGFAITIELNVDNRK